MSGVFGSKPPGAGGLPGRPSNPLLDAASRDPEFERKVQAAVRKMMAEDPTSVFEPRSFPETAIRTSGQPAVLESDGTTSRWATSANGLWVPKPAAGTPAGSVATVDNTGAVAWSKGLLAYGERDDGGSATFGSLASLAESGAWLQSAITFDGSPVLFEAGIPYPSWVSAGTVGMWAMHLSIGASFASRTLVGSTILVPLGGSNFLFGMPIHSRYTPPAGASNLYLTFQNHTAGASTHTVQTFVNGNGRFRMWMSASRAA